MKNLLLSLALLSAMFLPVAAQQRTEAEAGAHGIEIGHEHHDR